MTSLIKHKLKFASLLLHNSFYCNHNNLSKDNANHKTVKYNVEINNIMYKSQKKNIDFE